MQTKSSRSLSFLILAAIFFVMLAWTWYSWADPVVDFGRELYVPWQLLAGKTLYRDIAYFNGPLSPYFNTLVFAILGVSLRSLTIVNLLLLIALIAMIWRLWNRIAGLFAATVCCAVLLLVFSFLQLAPVANFNFVSPYSHEITHGVILGFAMITCFERFIATQRRGWLIIAGLGLGLILLTKIEITIAGAATAVVGMILIIRSAERAKPLGLIASFIVPAMLVPIAAFTLLCTRLSPQEALIGVEGSWRYAFDPRLTDLKFYRYIVGTLDLVGSIERICATLACYAIVCGIAKLAARMGTGRLNNPQRPMVCAVSFFVLMAVAEVTIYESIDPNYWQNSLRGFSILLPAMTIVFVVEAWRDRANSTTSLRAIIAVFATALLSKMPLNVISYHYGFALAMPATLLVVAGALAWLPKRFERKGGDALPAKAVMIAVILLFVAVHLMVFGKFSQKKTVLVGTGADAFYSDIARIADTRGQVVNESLEAVKHLPPNATLAVMPQGVMVNYLARRANPTPYIVLMPPEVLMFGIDKIRDSFAAHPPDYILFLDDSGRASHEYGVGPFGGDYGKPIFDLMRQNYEPIAGNAQDPSLAWYLLRRKS